ncbi:hypothetical protein [Paenibacillus donghaensis]|uniref:hypothetical protein n=1 Tax=Paenibacillus donghaensis TaxID=414771 RepID=UPI0012FE7069|nr:hypothetical protein [Paenibacillus donghaensis]
MQRSDISDFDLIDEDFEEFQRRGLESFGITDTQISVVTPHDIHSILIVNM